MNQPSRIILIDDSYTTNFLNKTVIQKSVFDVEVEEFQDPVLALESIENRGAEVSNWLIFVDINMPEYNGWEVVEKLIDLGVERSNAIVMLTSSIDPKDERKALGIEAIKSYETKPLTFEMLEKVIGRYFLEESSSL